ncbi:MAG: DUF1624 domain-containing protein [Bacteriovoracaceae bacterium]|nr:DUF1624 domain-containing protein [Bacteriovoracaceae bacterium]
MRAHFLDALRGMAVVWMIIFHAAYDMKMFNFISWDFSQGFWYAFPRVIAFTFLFCVGASLNYAHSTGPNWNILAKRSLKLALAAGAVSLGTYLLFPSQWVYFGTLHCILVGSVLGAMVVNKRTLAAVLLMLMLISQYLLGYDIKWVSSILQRPSLDFIPIYPWFWAILLGILVGPYLSRIPLLRDMKPQQTLNFMGRHSLKIYLLHQPFLFGCLWVISQVVSS